MDEKTQELIAEAEAYSLSHYAMALRDEPMDRTVREVIRALIAQAWIEGRHSGLIAAKECIYGGVK